MKALTRQELRSALVEREPADHKGVFGHVLIVAGARGMSGAAVLAGRAALRSGTGLVTIAMPAGIQNAVSSQVPEAMTLGLPENALGALRPDGVGRLKTAMKDKRYTVMGIGPGLSTHPDTARFVLLALSVLDLPAVVDADALNILAGQEPGGVRQLMRDRAHTCVFTPHPAELARCLRTDRKSVKADRQGSVETLAGDWAGVALLKGSETLVSAGSRTVVNQSGCPGLAKGGTGDVLTGLIAGLWAQSLASGRATGDTAFWAAALGAWLHGRAGEAAEKAKTPWAMTAGDVVEHFPDAFKAL